MRRTKSSYPTEFRGQLVELARAGRSVESLAEEYEPCAATIHDWVKQGGADAGEDVGHKCIERLMIAKGMRGVCRRKFVVMTECDPRARPASDLVDRNFYADAPNVLWVADITYVPTWTGFMYLAVVLDAFSRGLIGWAMGTRQRTQLVLDAMNMAVTQRKPKDVIHHSDQGSQYTFVALGLRCKEMGVRLSMGSVGDCYDNAMCESFFATLEYELLDRRNLNL